MEKDKKVVSNVDLNRREKVEEMMKNTFGPIYPHEAIELLLHQNSKVEDVNLLAHNILKTFHTFDCVLDAGFEALMAVPGMDEESAILISSIKGMFRMYLESKETGEDVTLQSLSNHYQNQIGFDVAETMIVTCFDTNHKVRREFKITNNSPTHVDVKVNTVISEIIKTKADFAVIAHNHPNGALSPSDADKNYCATVFKRLQLLNVGLADFIIVSGGQTYSMFTELKKRLYKEEELNENEKLIASSKSPLISDEVIMERCKKEQEHPALNYKLYNINGKIIGSDGDDFDGFYDRTNPILQSILSDNRDPHSGSPQGSNNTNGSKW